MSIKKRPIPSYQPSENTGMDEIMYRLIVLDKARKNQTTVEQGLTITNEKLINK